MLFIADVQYYIPIKLCKSAGSFHLFNITGILTPDKVKLGTLHLGYLRIRLQRGQGDI